MSAITVSRKVSPGTWLGNNISNGKAKVRQLESDPVSSRQQHERSARGRRLTRPEQRRPQGPCGNTAGGSRLITTQAPRGCGTSRGALLSQTPRRAPGGPETSRKQRHSTPGTPTPPVTAAGQRSRHRPTRQSAARQAGRKLLLWLGSAPQCSRAPRCSCAPACPERKSAGQVTGAGLPSENSREEQHQ